MTKYRNVEIDLFHNVLFRYNLYLFIYPSIFNRLFRGRIAVVAADPEGLPRLPSHPQHFPAHSWGSFAFCVNAP